MVDRQKRIGLGIFGVGVTIAGIGTANLLWSPGAERVGNLTTVAGLLVAAISYFVLGWPGMAAVRRSEYWPGQWKLRTWVTVVSVAVVLVAVTGWAAGYRRNLPPAAAAAAEPTPVPTPLALPAALISDSADVYDPPPWTLGGRHRALLEAAERLHERLELLEAERP